MSVLEVSDSAGIRTVIALDARSISQLLYMTAAPHDVGPYIVIWSGNAAYLDKAIQYLTLPPIVLRVKAPRAHRLWYDVRATSRLRREFSEIHRQFGPIHQLFTAYPYGLYFELIKRTFAISDRQVVLYDDGLANLVRCRTRYRLFKAAVYAAHGTATWLPRYRLYHDRRYRKIRTVFRERLDPDCMAGKRVFGISDDVRQHYASIAETHLYRRLNDDSGLLLTHHAVESRRLRERDYQNLISSTVNTMRTYTSGSIYYTKHHNESRVNDAFYESLGLELLDLGLPAEVYFSSPRLTVIGQPYNSAIPVLDSLDLLGALKAAISYIIPLSPALHTRRELIDRILTMRGIRHHVIRPS